MKRDVGAELDVEITAPTTLEFQIAVAPQSGAEVTESLSFVLDGKEIRRATSGDHRGPRQPDPHVRCRRRAT